MRTEGWVQGLHRKVETKGSPRYSKHPRAKNNNLIFPCSRFVTGWPPHPMVLKATQVSPPSCNSGNNERAAFVLVSVLYYSLLFTGKNNK